MQTYTAWSWTLDSKMNTMRSLALIKFAFEGLFMPSKGKYKKQHNVCYQHQDQHLYKLFLEYSLSNIFYFMLLCTYV